MSDMKKQTNKQTKLEIKPTVVHLGSDFFPSFPLMQKRIMLLYFYETHLVLNE